MDEYMGTVKLFAFNFAPRGWMPCDGRLLQINTNTALYSLIGVMYGGDGVTTFAPPDLRGRVALSQGQGKGLQNYAVGQMDGSENVTLNTSQIPAHAHAMVAVSDAPTQNTASGAALASGNRNVPMDNIYAPPSANIVQMGSGVFPTGGSQPHSNMQPYLTLNYCICTEGIYPPKAEL